MTATPQSYSNHRRVFPLYHLFALPVLLAHVAITLVGALREPTFWTFWMVVVAVGLVAAVVANRASTLIVQNRVIGLEMRLRLATILPVELCQRIPELRPQAVGRAALRGRRRADRPRGALPARRACDGRCREARRPAVASRLRARLSARRVASAHDRSSAQRLGVGRRSAHRALRLLLRRRRLDRHGAVRSRTLSGRARVPPPRRVAGARSPASGGSRRKGRHPRGRAGRTSSSPITSPTPTSSSCRTSRGR